MHEDPFHRIRELLDRYYDTVSYAQIDFEVETGLVSQDGLKLIRRAVSHVAKYIELGDDAELNKASHCLGEAVVTYRRELYTVVCEAAIEFLRKVNTPELGEFATNRQLATMKGARRQISSILSREQAVSEREKIARAPSEPDWEDVAGVYSKMTGELESIATGLEGLLVTLRARRH